MNQQRDGGVCVGLREERGGGVKRGHGRARRPITERETLVGTVLAVSANPVEKFHSQEKKQMTTSGGTGRESK